MNREVKFLKIQFFFYFFRGGGGELVMVDVKREVKFL